MGTPTQQLGDSEAATQTVAWLYETISGLVDDQTKISIERKYTAEETTFTIRTAPADMGKIIGKEGRTARALRLLLTARGKREKVNYGLDIMQEIAKSAAA